MSQAGRLTMRVEGDVWVAYFALPDTMDGAIELGRIARAIVTGAPAKGAQGFWEFRP